MSRLLANDKGNNEMKTRTVHRSGIYLTAEKNPENLMCDSHPSNGVPYLQITSVRSNSQSGRGMKTKELGRKDYVGSQPDFSISPKDSQVKVSSAKTNQPQFL